MKYVNITDIPTPVPIAAANSQSETGSSTSRQFGRTSSTNVNAEMNVDLDRVYRHESQAVDCISPEKLNTEYFTIEATEGAAMDVDDEDAADRQQL
jgi:hypothetical protein